jgi:hypothetical protein
VTHKVINLCKESLELIGVRSVPIEIETTINLSIGIQVNDCNVPTACIARADFNGSYLEAAIRI